jgi:chromate transporter
MIDGLALGETTPGPLIMVVAFVGFVGGYVKARLRSGQPVSGRRAAASLVTWFTFLPSFIFILAGGPLVETTHGDLKFTAPLTAITAAVVGVILDLVLFFARATLWPHGFSGSFDWLSALITLGAAIALLHYRRTTIEVIAGCALAGLLGQVLPV